MTILGGIWAIKLIGIVLGYNLKNKINICSKLIQIIDKNGEEETLPYRKIPKFQIINVEGMMAIEKSLFEHHSNNYCGQDSRMYAKTIEWKFKEKQNSCIASMYLPPRIY